MTTPYGSNFVPGEGPANAMAMLIGEGPGETENIRKRPFCGQSGQLLDMLLRVAGLDRSQLYITNLVKYRMPKNADPTPEDIARDWPTLLKELDGIKPRFIGLVGRIAAREFLGDIDMEWAHGLAFDGNEVARWRIAMPTFMPLYHPAYGLYKATALPDIQDDFQRFAALVRGAANVSAPQDQYPRPKYILLKGKLPVGKVGQDLPIYVDTEGTADKPWGLSFTFNAGKAYVILATNKKLLDEFRVYLSMCCDVVLHNAMHDIAVLRAMGIEITRFRDTRFRDTMVRAHHLCLEPQGLKPLARRHAGMVMQSYEEVVGDARRAKHLDYFRRALVWLDKHYPGESPERSRAPKSGSRTKKRSLPSAGTSCVKTSRKEHEKSRLHLVPYRKRLSTTSR